MNCRILELEEVIRRQQDEIAALKAQLMTDSSQQQQRHSLPALIHLPQQNNQHDLHGRSQSKERASRNKRRHDSPTKRRRSTSSDRASSGIQTIADSIQQQDRANQRQQQRDDRRSQQLPTPPGDHSQSTRPSASVYITGLAASATRLLRDFGHFGHIVDQPHVMAKGGPDGRAHAYVNYDTVDAATQCVKQMNGQVYKGQRITVAYSRTTKANRPLSRSYKEIDRQPKWATDADLRRAEATFFVSDGVDLKRAGCVQSVFRLTKTDRLVLLNQP